MMKLPKLPFFDKKPEIEYFLALILRDDKINSFIFEQKEGVIKIVNSQEEMLADSLDKTSYEELLDATDKVVSQAEDELDLPLEVQKTIFGLKESWVKDAKIKPEHLETLKKLSNSLGLIPIGFLTISEAVVSLLQKEEGAPPSAILIDVGKNAVTVSSVRAGKVVEVKTSEIHQTSVFTVDTLLKHFESVEILPAKVILLNEDEELVQEFISHQWSKSLPFLHLPQIVSLQSDSIAKAFIIGLANQTGVEVRDEFKSENVEQAPEEAQTETTQPQSNIKFVDTPDYFGFTNKDVAQVPPLKVEGVEKVQPEVFEEIPQLPADFLVVLPKVKSFIVQLLSKIKTISFHSPQNLPIKNRRVLYILTPVILLLLFFVYYIFFLNAAIVLTVAPKVVEKNQDITFSTAASDFKNNTIKGEFVEVSEDGSLSTNTTGKKETGDKAKGTVTIFNSSKSTVTLAAKTTIKSSNGLNFLTLDKVTVASESADVPPKSGQINVNVEAEKFGTEFNLPSGVKFLSIAGNADISAKNDNPFSGGTKKEIQVVSKEDVLKVEEDLIKSLEEKAKNDTFDKLSTDKDLLPDFIEKGLEEKTLDKEIDSEAKSVKLTGTVSFQSLAYVKDELLNFLKTIFPSSQSIDKDNIDLKFENVKKADRQVTANMNVKVKIIPKIDVTDLAKKIAGQSFVKAKNELSGIAQVSDVEIKFSPNLGFLPKTLPRISKNIKITILEND